MYQSTVGVSGLDILVCGSVQISQSADDRGPAHAQNGRLGKDLQSTFSPMEISNTAYLLDLISHRSERQSTKQAKFPDWRELKGTSQRRVTGGSKERMPRQDL